MKCKTLIVFWLGRVLSAQVDAVALKNWPAPLHWQAPRPELRSSSTGSASLTSSTMYFVAMAPCRVVDTRTSQMFPAPFGPPSLASGPARSFPIQSSTGCTIPSNAQAYSFNVTVIPPGSLGYLTLWPQGQGQPNAVTLDDITGDIRNNAAIVPAGTPNGGISAVVNGPTDLVIDINGYYAPLNTSDSGNANIAIGFEALFHNTSGNTNTAIGSQTLFSNTTGSGNTAIGFAALYSNTTGSNNTANGYAALISNTTGSFNVAVGLEAGSNITTGSNNIDIANSGTASDDGVIRIGTAGLHTSFFVPKNISGWMVSDNVTTVLIDSTGQLGTQGSSRRFKEDIQDMAEASNGLLRLRPVKFRYRKTYLDGSKPLDYGLIAEEVAEVYPDLVVKDKDGQAETVQYHKLIPMLLNEVRKEHETKLRLEEQLSELEREPDTAASLRTEIWAMRKALDTLLACVKEVGETACPATKDRGASR